jgi:hypothetical protein
MATRVLTNAYVSLNSVNLSDHGQTVTLETSAALLDDTAFGDTAQSRAGGLKDWTLTVNFFADEAAGSVLATLFPLIGSTMAVEVRADAGSVSATNPKYTGTGILESLQPVAGQVGQMQMTQAVLRAAGTALTRATS